jgi:hypothetical protein
MYTKKYENWPWARHLEFLELAIQPATFSGNLNTLENDGCPQLLSLPASGCPAEPQQHSSQLPPLPPPPPQPPRRNQKRGYSTENVADKIIDYFEANRKTKKYLTDIDHLFLNYAKIFKLFSPKRQVMLKMELAALFANAEMGELGVQPGQHFPTVSPRVPQELYNNMTPLDSSISFAEQTYIDTAVRTNANNQLEPIDLSSSSSPGMHIRLLDSQ